MDDPSIVKGKRTKRQRLLQLYSSAACSSTSLELSESTTDQEEEEEMANCLILLAQGAHKPATATDQKSKTTTTGKASGFYVYECKTCSKCFPSFQALGGHRASHKKPKLNSFPPPDETKDDSIQLSMMNNNSSSFGLQAKARIHECSICRAEFTSGQALGGHMRRHRPPPKKEGNSSNALISLDLNLPAPPEDDGDFGNSSSPVSTPPFSLSTKTTTPILLLTSALVDCHY